MLIVLKAIATAIAVLGGLGLALGLLLALAAKVLAVEQDPRQKRLLKHMPGADCGACGFADCSAYAGAVAAGTTVVGACPVGGVALAKKMARVMGVADTGVNLRQVTLVRCSGAGGRCDAEGVRDCLAADRAATDGCRYGCLALGSCAQACDFDAISLSEGAARVDLEKCVGCLKCVGACPRHLITVVPYGSDVVIPCSARGQDPSARGGCGAGCTGCGLCVKACPSGAISVKDGLASIDWRRCVSCGACIEKCPQKLLRRASVSHEGEEKTPYLLPQ